MKLTRGNSEIQRTRKNCDKARNEQQKSMLLNEVSRLHFQNFLRLKHTTEHVTAGFRSIREKLHKGPSRLLRKAS